MIRRRLLDNWIYIAAGAVLVFIVAGDIVLHPDPAPAPIVQKSFHHVATDLRDATVIPNPPGSREIRIDVRLAIIPQGSTLEDLTKSQTLAAMSNRDCALLIKGIAENCRIENSHLREIQGGGATSFTRYVIKPKPEMVSR